MTDGVSFRGEEFLPPVVNKLQVCTPGGGGGDSFEKLEWMTDIP